MLPQFVDETFAPCWVKDLSNEQYHADKTAVSSSAVKRIMKSPKSFHAYVKGEIEFKETPAMRLGSLLHLALLEPELFQKTYVLEPKFIGKTKDGRDSTRSGEAKAAREEWKLSLPADAVIVSEDEMHDIEGMIESVMRHRDAKNMLRNGTAEISGYYRDPTTGIKCKIRPDFFLERHMAVMDVKTTEDCSVEAFSRSIWSWRYDIQMGMYCAGIEFITGKKVEYPLYLVIERKPPYECAVYRCDDGLVARGKIDYEACLDKLKFCLETNQWDSYQKKMDYISLPKWADAPL